MAAISEPRPEMAAVPEPHNVMASSPESLHKMAASPDPLYKMAASPQPLYKMAAMPEPPAVMDIKRQSLAITDATPVFRFNVYIAIEDTQADAFEDMQAVHRRLRLASCLADPLLVSASAAGNPRALALVVTG